MPGDPATRWERVHELFLAASQRPPSEQEQFVRAAASDAATATEVLGLLRAHEAEGRFDALLDRFASLTQQAGATAAPTSIGPYRILRPLGSGGMGDVYLAERADGQFEHRVAIKLLRPDRAGPELKRRFLTERQILAQLVHRNIAWLLDGNVTADGSPYLVMEYVQGRPLLDHCDAERLSVRRRLELFLDVCAAVEYAHRRLIVHRDLKPGNILVGEDGVVKLLDFGIAKLLDATEDPSLTRTGQRVMTPEYATPEQVRGDPIGTPSDVYQLGLLLYELLTGRRAYRGAGGAGGSIESAILSAEPVRPSAAVTLPPEADAPTARATAAPETTADLRGTTASRLNRQLAGDLDDIILKALRKEPEERYGSATELADDVRRHLDGRPVLARRGTFRYRASRFVRRHRAGVAAAALIALSLVAGAAGTAWQAARAAEQARFAEAERDRARVEAEKATRLAGFLTGLFDVASEGGVRTDTLRLLPVLERGAARIDTELRDQPEVRAAALIAVSDLYEKLGRFDEAQHYAEEAVRQRRATPGGADPELAEALDNLGGVLMDRGDIAGAEKNWAEAAAIRRGTLAAAAAPDSALREQTASSLHNLAVARWRQRRLEAADSLETEALALYEAAGATRSTKMAGSLDVLALIRQDQGREDEMLPLMQRALEIRRDVLPDPHYQIAVSLNNLATGLLAQRRATEAEPMMRESLAMRRALFGDEHPQVAAAIHNLGAALEDLGREEEAIAHYEQGLEMRRRLLGERHLDVALSLSSLATLHHERGRCREALPLLLEAVPIWRAGLGEQHGIVLKTRGYLGDCLARTGRRADAERELLAAHDALARTVGESHSETQRVRRFLRQLYEGWGRPADAARYATEGGGS